MESVTDIKQLFQFLTQLGANNDREWFKQHKPVYDQLRKSWLVDTQRVINLISEWDDSVCGLDASDAVYRIYRDIRFSPDKRPFKTYFSACLGRNGRRCQSFSLYFHLQPGHCLVGGGVWMPEKDKLNAMRSLIDAEQTEFAKIVNDAQFATHFKFESESLKRVPKDFPADHPLGEFLKMKEFIVAKQVEDSYFLKPDWIDCVNADLKRLKPLKDFLDYVYDF